MCPFIINAYVHLGHICVYTAYPEWTDDVACYDDIMLNVYPHRWTQNNI